MSIPANYCPQCGSQDVSFADRHLSCGNCGCTIFINSAAAVGGLIIVDGGLLLAVRSRDPGKGLLDLPGGFLEWNEDAETGLRREIDEELGIDITDIRYLRSGTNQYNYRNVTYYTCDLFYTCRPVDLTDLIARDDVAATCIRDPKSIQAEEVAFPSAIEAIQFYVRHFGT